MDLEGILRKTKGPGQGVVLSRGVVREKTDLFWTLNPERWSHAFFASKMSSYTTNAWPRRGAVRSELAPSSATVCPETCRDYCFCFLVCAIEIRIREVGWIVLGSVHPQHPQHPQECVSRDGRWSAWGNTWVWANVHTQGSERERATGGGSWDGECRRW